MFAKILRGLRHAVLRFDAWMTEKPKLQKVNTSVSRNAEAERINQTRRYLEMQAYSLRGGIRDHGSLPHDRWMDP